MKVEARVLEVDSTLEGEKVGMTIDDGALAHIMSVLTDLYSDPELAVIREYSTNALDAHIEAGQTRPIEVTLPTSLAPFFRVRDFGVGLDADDIREIYSRYGASTKRESNDVVGMLGLGCKSALTYSDQFTLSGTKDGICTQVSVSRDEDGSGSMTIVTQYETDDPNGVEIIVPAKRGNSFESKALHFFRFWKPGTVLVNSQEPKHIDGLWLAEDLLLTKDTGENIVVMGNVAYPVPEHVGYNERPYVAFVNIGDVNFTPSRESLQMTAKTKMTLNTVKERVRKETGPAIERLVNEAPTKREALRIALDAKNVYSNIGKLTYQGQPIPLIVEAPKMKIPNSKDGTVREAYDPFMVVSGRKQYRGHKGWSWENKLVADGFKNTLWIINHDGSEFSPYKRLKLEQWLSTEGIAVPNQLVLCKSVPVEVFDWIDATTIYDYDKINSQKIIRENVTKMNGAPSGSYKGYVPGGQRQSTLMAADIDTTQPIYFTSKDGNYAAQKVVMHHHKNMATIVEMGLNRFAKFQRDFPSAKNLADTANTLVKSWVANLSEEDKVSLHLHRSNETRTLLLFEAERINDPKFKQAIEVAKTKNVTLLADYGVYENHIRYENYEPTTWVNPMEKYALLTQMSFYGKINEELKNHLYLYINTAYAVEQEKN